MYRKSLISWFTLKQKLCLYMHKATILNINMFFAHVKLILKKEIYLSGITGLYFRDLGAAEIIIGFGEHNIEIKQTSNIKDQVLRPRSCTCVCVCV